MAEGLRHLGVLGDNFSNFWVLVFLRISIKLQIHFCEGSKFSTGHFCSRPDLGINCALGVAVLGFSLGGQIALKLRNFNANVSAALSIAGSILFEGQCLMSHDFVLERSKRRITVGSDDRHYGSLVKCVGSSGYDCGSNHCIQPDGSGFYMVTEDEIGRSPHHNYYIDPLTQGMAQDFKSSEAPWGFAACVRWLVGASSAQCTQ